MANELTIRISGEAGQGMQTIGGTLCMIFKKTGFNIFADQDYMSRIRGGNNYFQIRVSGEPVYTLRNKCDILVALDKDSVDMHKKHINNGGTIILDRTKFGITEQNTAFFDIPMYDIANTTGGKDIFVSSIACGVLADMMGIAFNAVEEMLKQAFSDKGADIIDKNFRAARAGYEFSNANFKSDKYKIKPGAFRETMLVNGHDALALGALKAGCKFYSGYPMTPSTAILNSMAHWAHDYGIVVEQAEDEIAAINMIIGASYAGVRSMTATSGGGFCLMNEGLSLAGMTETPVVIVLGQRPAPATGFPTRTEQGELGYAIHAGHGEFARAVFTPGTIEEAFYLTIKAFDIAEKYQIPVLILTDQHLADSYRNADIFDTEDIKIERHIISKEESKNVTGYKRYRFTNTGISPRAVPGWIEDAVYADSDEHTEEGHITEDAEIRRKMVAKRFCRKIVGISKETEKPVVYKLDGAENIIVGFGSTYGALKEVADALDGRKTGFIHLPQVWPFPAGEMIELLKNAKRIFTVENNAGAQLAGLLRCETGIKASGSILKYDGRPFNLDDLKEQVESMLSRTPLREFAVQPSVRQIAGGQI